MAVTTFFVPKKQGGGESESTKDKNKLANSFKKFKLFKCSSCTNNGNNTTLHNRRLKNE